MFKVIGEFLVFLVAPRRAQGVELIAQRRHALFQVLVELLEVVGKPPQFGRVDDGLGHGRASNARKTDTYRPRGPAIFHYSRTAIDVKSVANTGCDRSHAADHGLEGIARSGSWRGWPVIPAADHGRGGIARPSRRECGRGRLCRLRGKYKLFRPFAQPRVSVACRAISRPR